jgi:hypothetical protein
MSTPRRSRDARRPRGVRTDLANRVGEDPVAYLEVELCLPRVESQDHEPWRSTKIAKIRLGERLTCHTASADPCVTRKPRLENGGKRILAIEPIASILLYRRGREPATSTRRHSQESLTSPGG